MSRFPRLSFSFLALALGASFASADYIVVAGQGGPGVDYTTVAAAVEAASHGDRILVHPGTYLDPISTSKGVAIIGLGLDAQVGRPRLGPVEWTGLGPFHQASLSSVDLTSVELTQCAGTVSLLDLHMDDGGPFRSVVVEDCSDVRVRDLYLTGRSDDASVGQSYLENNDAAFHSRNSTVEIVSSYIRGPRKADSFGRAAGVRSLEGSFVSVHRTDVKSGSPYSDPFFSVTGPAIAVDDDESAAWITGGLDGTFTITGIDAYGPIWGGGANEAHPGIHNEGTVRVSGVTVVGGSGTGVWDPAPPIENNGTLIEPLPLDPSFGVEFDTTFDLTGNTSVTGTMTLRVSGPVGEPVELLIGRRPSLAFLTPDGYPRSTQPHRTIALGVIPPSGELVHPITLPPNVAVGDRFVLQALVGFGATARYTNSAPVVLR